MSKRTRNPVNHHIYTNAHTYTHTHIHTHKCTHICTHTYANAHTHIYAHTYTHTHTHTCTHTVLVGLSVLKASTHCCQVYYSSSLSLSLSLVYFAATTFNITPPAQTPTFNGPLNLTCSYDLQGATLSRVLWFINGEYTTNTSSLMLAAVRQSGYYQCVAVGDNGASSLGTIWITPERKDLLLVLIHANRGSIYNKSSSS